MLAEFSIGIASSLASNLLVFRGGMESGAFGPWGDRRRDTPASLGIRKHPPWVPQTRGLKTVGPTWRSGDDRLDDIRLGIDSGQALIQTLVTVGESLVVDTE